MKLFITSGGEQLKKSISRSTLDLALKKTREKEITGPKALGVPGAGSYLYAMFMRFGLIT
jgi:gamma-glutamyltranspeptidase